jgi:hypothetical protein
MAREIVELHVQAVCMQTCKGPCEDGNGSEVSASGETGVLTGKVKIHHAGNRHCRFASARRYLELRHMRSDVRGVSR